MGKEDEGFLEAKARKAKGQRGKSSEALVEEVLLYWKTNYPTFDYDRLPDTRAAGRIMPARVSDFTLFYNKSYSLEVKEIKEGTLLKQFPQYPRMIRRSHSGCLGLVLVHLLEYRCWVLVDLGWLELNYRENKSWDISRHPQYTSAGLALRTVFNMRLP